MGNATLVRAAQLVDQVFDLVEDAMFVDRPILPTTRRRVQAANRETVRFLRVAVATDADVLRPSRVRTISSALALHHDVRPRHMMSMAQMSEALTLEFVATPGPVEERLRLIERAESLGRRGHQNAAPDGRLTKLRPATVPRPAALLTIQLVLTVAAVIGILAGVRLYGVQWDPLPLMTALGVLVITAMRATIARDRDRVCLTLGTPPIDGTDDGVVIHLHT